MTVQCYAADSVRINLAAACHSRLENHHSSPVKEQLTVTNFMRSRTSEIVVCRRTTGNRLGEDVASVLVVGRTPGRSIGREVADAEQATAKVGEEVDVQVCVGALAERGLHLRVVVAGRPVVVYGEVGADEGEADAVWVVALVHDVDLQGC